MTRKLKFRAYDKKEKKWCFGYETLGGFSMFGELHIMDELHVLEKLNDIEVMQFTGLLDKNGKEIYEGDVVKYQRGSNDVVDSVESFGTFFGVSRYTGILDSFYPIEIIGNIYENPSLLSA